MFYGIFFDSFNKGDIIILEFLGNIPSLYNFVLDTWTKYIKQNGIELNLYEDGRFSIKNYTNHNIIWTRENIFLYIKCNHDLTESEINHWFSSSHGIVETVFNYLDGKNKNYPEAFKYIFSIGDHIKAKSQYIDIEQKRTDKNVCFDFWFVYITPENILVKLDITRRSKKQINDILNSAYVIYYLDSNKNKIYVSGGEYTKNRKAAELFYKEDAYKLKLGLDIHYLMLVNTTNKKPIKFS